MYCLCHNLKLRLGHSNRCVYLPIGTEQAANEVELCGERERTFFGLQRVTKTLGLSLSLSPDLSLSLSRISRIFHSRISLSLSLSPDLSLSLSRISDIFLPRISLSLFRAHTLSPFSRPPLPPLQSLGSSSYHICDQTGETGHQSVTLIHRVQSPLDNVETRILGP